MSNYSQTTFFSPKDALTTGDPDKVIFGAEIDPELSAISTAIGTKVDTADSGLEITNTTVRLSLVDLTAVTPVSGDSFVFADASDSDNEKRVTLANLNSALEHDSLAGLVADEHVAHSGVVLTAGHGLSGGGDISLSRTFDVVEAELAHDSLSGFVADEHIPHSSIMITAGTGLTGGGTIDGDVTISMPTPDSVSLDTGNTVTDSGHTHALSGSGIVRTEPGTGGAITVSTAAASGAATNGDMWLQV